MFNIINKVRSQAGFTMIELLVVIAVIGILATAVLSAINPIEQINKGRDTRGKTDSAQLIEASDRFFAIHEDYPWNEPNSGVTGTFAASWSYDPASPPTGVTGSALTDYKSAFTFDESVSGVTDQSWAWALPLLSTNEVKESYLSRLTKVSDNTEFYIYKPAGSNKTMYVCFTPASFAFDLEASQRCDSTVTAKYDSQLATDVPVACGDHDADGTSCFANTGDTDKCMICLP